MPWELGKAEENTSEDHLPGIWERTHPSHGLGFGYPWARWVKAKGTARNSGLPSLWDLPDHFYNLVGSSGMSQEKPEFNTGGGKTTTGHC